MPPISSWHVFSGSHLDLPGALALVSRVAVQFAPDAAGSSPPPPAPAAVPMESDTGELRWHTSTTQGYLAYTTPRSSGALGFLAARTVPLGDMELTVLPSDLGWATAGLTLVRGEALATGGNAVFVATGRCENTGQRWRDAAQTTLSAWGTAPTRVEVVPLRLVLPVPASRTRAWALDERGQRRAPAVIEAVDAARSALVTRPADATLWYEIETDPPSTVSFESWRARHFTPAELAQSSLVDPSASPAGDGIPNLVKYALGLDPKVPANRTALAQWGLQGTPPEARLWLAFVRSKAATDAVVEAAFGSILPSSWRPATVVSVEDLGATERVRAEERLASAAPGQGFFGLSVRSRTP